MKMKNDKADIGYEGWKLAVENFLMYQNSFKKEEIRFKKAKENFYAYADKFLSKINADEDMFVSETLNASESTNNAFVVSVKKIIPTKVKYFAEKLEEKLGKKFCKDFVDKTYIISDYTGMVEMLKSHGIKPNEFLKFISVEKTVDESKINQLYATGEITEKDVDGCYEVTKGNRYFKVTTKKR